MQNIRLDITASNLRQECYSYEIWVQVAADILPILDPVCHLSSSTEARMVNLSFSFINIWNNWHFAISINFLLVLQYNTKKERLITQIYN